MFIITILLQNKNITTSLLFNIVTNSGNARGPPFRKSLYLCQKKCFSGACAAIRAPLLSPPRRLQICVHQDCPSVLQRCDSHWVLNLENMGGGGDRPNPHR